MLDAPTLADLASATGLPPRTIRSWVAMDLLSGPISKGPGAKYPPDSLERLLAIRSMRELLGLSLTQIRRSLLVMSPEEIRQHAEKALVLAPETLIKPPLASEPAAPKGAAALDYIRTLRAQAASRPAAPPSAAAQVPASSRGLDALEQQLLQAVGDRPARKARGQEWLRVTITPDVELSFRGSLDPDQRAQIERCADLIRDILLGRT